MKWIISCLGKRWKLGVWESKNSKVLIVESRWWVYGYTSFCHNSMLGKSKKKIPWNVCVELITECRSLKAIFLDENHSCALQAWPLSHVSVPAMPSFSGWWDVVGRLTWWTSRWLFLKQILLVTQKDKWNRTGLDLIKKRHHCLRDFFLPFNPLNLYLPFNWPLNRTFFLPLKF